MQQLVKGECNFIKVHNFYTGVKGYSHSLLRLFTGFAIAALIAWKSIVIMVIVITKMVERINTEAFTVIR